MRLALRSLLKSPGFTTVAVLTIAVGIGTNSALFSIFSRLVLHPVTLPQPHTLVALWSVNESQGFNAPAVSWSRYEWIRDQATSFSSVANSASDSFTLTDQGDPLQLNGLRITANFLPTIGIAPALGRNFAPEEDLPNGPSVAILSHEAWRDIFGSRVSIIGETITLGGASWEVIGVLPPRLSNPFGVAQVFIPRVFDVGALTPQQIEHGAGFSQPVARLRPGVSLEAAAAELKSLSASYQEAFGSKLDANNATVARDFRETLVGNIRPTFYLLLAAVGFVLLIACANVASLFLGRLTSRHKEIALRQSLGATRGTIVRLFLGESLLFSALAGVAGVLLAVWSLDALQRVMAAQLPPNTELSLDMTAVAFTTAITVLCSFLVGLVPAWQASQTDLVSVLKDGGRSTTGPARGKRFRAILIVSEVALSVLLLVGSSLLFLSFLQLQRTPPGYDPVGVASAFVVLPSERYRTEEERTRFFCDVIERLEAQPRVEAAAVAVGLPFSGVAPQMPYSIAGQTIVPLAQRPLAGLRVVSEDYFRLMRIPLREGRAFTAEDRMGAPGVVIINESFARRLFPGESALGKVFLRGRDAEIPIEVVGVIADVRSNGLLAPPPDELYYTYRQLARPLMPVVARTSGDPQMLHAAIRRAVADVDPQQAVAFFQTLEDALHRSLGVQRVVATLTAFFAGMALLLAVVGLYSVLAYAVTQRTSEIGLRMALGAQRGEVIRMILGDGMGLVAVGLGVGLAAAAATSRLLQSQLFGIEPLNPIVYLGVAVLFALIAILACLAPSLRASRIEPIVALRAE